MHADKQEGKDDRCQNTATVSTHDGSHAQTQRDDCPDPEYPLGNQKLDGANDYAEQHSDCDERVVKINSHFSFKTNA